MSPGSPLRPAAMEHAYRYPAASGLRTGRAGPRLTLATSGGPAANPRLFRGTVTHPEVTAEALLAVAVVARTRYHTPPAMLARILLTADPIVTCADGRIRFEGFSACCSVHARLDLLEGAVDGETLGRGSTNVDVGPGMRAALAGVVAGQGLSLEIGLDEVEVRAGGMRAVERRVPLPARWIRGLTELAAIQASMTLRFSLARPDALRLVRSLRRATAREVWLVASGSGLRIAHHPAAGSLRLGGPDRLRPLERLTSHLRALRILGAADGSTAWQADLPESRLTLVLSPDPWRGLSGEGRLLSTLVARPSRRALAAVRARLRWQARVPIDEMAAETGLDPAATEAALASLAASGVLGLDLADGGYFQRELPFDLSGAERLQPRLRDARRLVATGSVRVERTDAEELVAWVAGSGVEHRVRVRSEGAACTCPWFGRHRGERGPCKHVLAVQIVTMGFEDG
jgi:hypothetical protein